ncbi:MAG TPA: coenzyme F420-0:L-glutamate ligase, partial [Blastocatellia bacterium]
MTIPEIRIIGVVGMPEIGAGDDLPSLIAAAVRGMNVAVMGGDIFVVAQKVVSKAEGRSVRLDSIEPSHLARE